jgi:hypothetical protein
MRLRRKTKREREQQRIEDEEYVRRVRAGELTSDVEPEGEAEPVVRSGVVTVDPALVSAQHRTRVEAVELERHNRRMRLPDPLIPGAPTPSVVKPRQPRFRMVKDGVVQMLPNAGPPPEPKPRPKVVVDKAGTTVETDSMRRAWGEYLAKAHDDDPQPEHGTPAWDAWWYRERLRRSGYTPDMVKEAVEQQALARIDELRERDIARTHDTPAARRRRSQRHWKPRIHEDILGGTRSFGESRTLNHYQGPGVKAGD